MKSDGSCETCPFDSYPDPNEKKRSCKKLDDCDDNQHVVQSDGTCKTCVHQKVSKDKRSCVDVNCNQREKLKNDGSCEQCPQYLAVSDDLKSCVTPKCGDRDIILESGKC